MLKQINTRQFADPVSGFKITTPSRDHLMVSSAGRVVRFFTEAGVDAQGRFATIIHIKREAAWTNEVTEERSPLTEDDVKRVVGMLKEITARGLDNLIAEQR